MYRDAPHLKQKKSTLTLTTDMFRWNAVMHSLLARNENDNEKSRMPDPYNDSMQFNSYRYCVVGGDVGRSW